MKNQNIENFKQVIDLGINITLIDPKEMVLHITDSILATINFIKFNEKKQVTIELTHEYYAKYVDIHITNEIKEYIRNNLQQPSWSAYLEKNEDQVKSAIEILNLYNDIEILLYIINNEVIIIVLALER
ncbi:23754_t:CDS:2 [Gigaspora rosea]|nr:23754_t:CDS:2 [Gigaspora rosea]